LAIRNDEMRKSVELVTKKKLELFASPGRYAMWAGCW